jgi:hypothetical protein
MGDMYNGVRAVMKCLLNVSPATWLGLVVVGIAVANLKALPFVYHVRHLVFSF